MIKPAGRSYLCDAFAGVRQQPAADFQPVLIQESHRGLFQIPVILGFFISYFGSAAEMNGLIKVSEYVPVVSPFVMPADLLVGKASMAEGIISLLVLIAFTFVLVLVTGKLYKNKVFHRK